MARGLARSLATALFLWFCTLPAEATNISTPQDALYDGALAGGAALPLGNAPHDDAEANRRFALGVVRFARSIEHLGQSLYRYGLRSPPIGVPILRMPVPENPLPGRLTYEDFRSVLQAFVDDLMAADDALAGVGDGPVHLAVDIGRIRLDLTGDGGRRDDERLWTIATGTSPSLRSAADDDLRVVLDSGDLAWLRGYAHLSSGFCEWMLAHDFRDMFDATFELFFPRAGSADAYTREEDGLRANFSGVRHGDRSIADSISLVHLVRWPVAEPARLQAARGHLLQVIASSRASWHAILARHDDERHWIPAPGGKSVVSLPVTRERIDAWFKVLDDAQAILEGRRLVPHWRYRRGIDIARVFEEPRTFDLVLWLTGPGALPFLADGEMISQQNWGQIERAFGGDFLNYAFWFN